MAFSLRWLLVLGITLSPAPQFLPSAAAQGPLAGHSPPPISGLRLLTRNSGYIFDGTVLSVERVAEADPSSLGAVQITFRVERAIRGVRNGQVLTIREWTGLWNSGERYRTGERLLLFLYRPSKLGLTSPVGGSLGRFAIDSNDQVILNPECVDALSSDPALSDPAIETGLRGKSRWSSRELVRAIRRAAEE